MKKKKTGRPQKSPEIPVAKIAALAAIACTDEEIARVCGFSVDTLTRRFAELLKTGRAEMKASIRRRQFEIMNSRAPQAATMSIWLGKQELGQRDSHEVSGPSGGAVQVQLVSSIARPKRAKDA